MYLVNPEGSAHQQIYLNNRVLTFTTDISQVKCGYNAAFYFSNMNPSAPLGTQCTFSLILFDCEFTSLVCTYVDCDGQGTCNEYDVLEANIAAINQATHGCQGAKDNCDHWGCSINSRTLGVAIAPSPKSVIDLGKPFTVSTTFRTADGTDNGVLVAIEQVYSQGSKSFSLPTINDNYCLALGAADPQYPTTGKLVGLSDAFKSGMTMVFSLWGDGTDAMKWLDNGLSNPNCKAAANGNNSAKFSNIQVSRISKR